MKYQDVVNNLTPELCLYYEKNNYDYGFEEKGLFIEKWGKDKLIAYLMVAIEDYNSEYDYDSDEAWTNERKITPLTAATAYETLCNDRFTEIYFAEKDIVERKKSLLTYFGKSALDELDVIVFDIKEFHNVFIKDNYEVVEWMPTKKSNSGKTIYESEPNDAHKLPQLYQYNERCMFSELFDPDATPNNLRHIKHKIKKIEESIQELHDWLDDFNTYYCDRENNIASFGVNLIARKAIKDFAKNWEPFLKDMIEKYKVGVSR